MILDPVTLYGEGQYNLLSLKEIYVTDSFMGLDKDTRKCQNIETFDDCKTRQYVENLVAIHIDSMAGEITNKNTTITSLLSIMLISCFRFVSPAEPRAGYEDLSCVCETNITPGGSSH